MVVSVMIAPQRQWRSGAQIPDKLPWILYRAPYAGVNRIRFQGCFLNPDEYRMPLAVNGNYASPPKAAIAAIRM
jgi:hypothetical protein